MNKKSNEKYSQQLIDVVAELLLPEIQKFYESEERKAFLRSGLGIRMGRMDSVTA